MEPRGTAGYDGPGWQAQGWGEVPTWFDVSVSARGRERLYSGGSPGISRGHGHWHSDENLNLATAMNKDWPGRPLFTQAYAAAYFASRQWVQAVRSWVNDDAFWGRVLAYANRGGGDLDRRGIARRAHPTPARPTRSA